MSCLRSTPLIGGGDSKVAVENAYKSERATDMQSDRTRGKNKKMRVRSRRKNSKVKEDERIQQWNKKVERWKAIINTNKLIRSAKIK